MLPSSSPGAQPRGDVTRCSRQCAARSIGSRSKRSGSKPLGLTTQRLASIPSRADRAVDLRRRQDQQPLGALGPAPHPPRPGLRVRPRRAVGDLLEHQQLGAVQVRDDRDAGRDARGGLVQRREVVEVQDVALGRAGGRERVRPRGDVRLEARVVDRREDLVVGAGPVLEGRVHRRVAGVEVDRPDVEAVVEAARVAVAGAARARHERDVPAVGGQLAGQRAGDVRRAATREEHQAGEDAHSSVI